MWPLRLAWALAALGIAAGTDPTAPPPDKASIFADLTPAELRVVRDFLMGRPELGLSPSRGGLPGAEHALPGGAAAPQEAAGPAPPGQGRPRAPAPGSSRRLFRGAGGAQRHRIRRGAPAAAQLLPAPALQGQAHRALRRPAHDAAGVRAAAPRARAGDGAAVPAAARRHRLLVPQLHRPLPHLLGHRTPRAGARRAPQLVHAAALRGGLLPAPRGAGDPHRPPGPRPAPLGRPEPLVQQAVLLQPAGAGRALRAGAGGRGTAGRPRVPAPLLHLRAARALHHRHPHRRARGQGVRAPGPALPAAGEPAGVRGLEPGLPPALLLRPPALRPALQRGARGLRGERAGGHRLLRRRHAGRHADQVHRRRLGHGLRHLRAGPRHRLPRGGHVPGRPPLLRRRQAGAFCPRRLHLRAAHGRPAPAALQQQLPGRVPLLRRAGGARPGAAHNLHRLQLRLHLGLPPLPQRRDGGQGPRHRLHPRHLLYAAGPALRQPRPEPRPGQHAHPPGALQGGPGHRRCSPLLTPWGWTLCQQLREGAWGWHGAGEGARGHVPAAAGIPRVILEQLRLTASPLAGTGNSFETVDLSFENISNPWSPDARVVQPWLHRQPRRSERQAAFPLGQALPRYLLFSNPRQHNRWGHARSYRIQHSSHAGRVLPRGWREERGISWGRYHLAVTRHHENEAVSSSLYTQNDPWEPLVNFESFIRDDESIEDQDLVAWVTVGFLHVPHAEDVPNTATPGNAVGFFLRPFNFFDEDPSVASLSPIIVRPLDQTFSRLEVQRWTPDTPGPCVAPGPFTYNGTYRPE
uniref:Amine oxidase n=1 Tax=Cairina moschata TaxID=8855 RepID=A0A8C3CJ48_CAIMO